MIPVISRPLNPIQPSLVSSYHGAIRQLMGYQVSSVGWQARWDVIIDGTTYTFVPDAGVMFDDVTDPHIAAWRKKAIDRFNDIVMDLLSK